MAISNTNKLFLHTSNTIMFRLRKHKKDLEIDVSDGAGIVYDEEIPIENVDISTPNSPKPSNEAQRISYDTESSDSDGPELELPDNNQNDSHFLSNASPPSVTVSEVIKFQPSMRRPRIQSTKPGPSRENTQESRPKSGAGTRPPKPLLSATDSESDSDDGLMVMEHPRGPLPGEYDPDKFNDLDVTEDIKDLFQYITKYTPQHLNLDYKFKPFIPDYIPAVGDIDAFLKVVPPERMILGGESADFSNLGLIVLDEPAANQSDSALLHLQLRAVTVTTNKDNKNMIIKKVDNVEKNSKTIDKWIIDISDLHRSKPPPMVKYTSQMPDIDSLMQEWPQSLELLLRKDGFPSHKLDCSLSDYVDLTCALFDVPVYEKKIQSLHLLFSLFVAIKSSQLYNVGNEGDIDESAEKISNNEQHINTGTTDQLILD